MIEIHRKEREEIRNNYRILEGNPQRKRSSGRARDNTGRIIAKRY
jgi:hypothetical protein